MAYKIRAPERLCLSFVFFDGIKVVAAVGIKQDEVSQKCIFWLINCLFECLERVVVR